jgi:hypothetical protein
MRISGLTSWKHGAADKKAVLIALKFEAAPVDDKLRPFLDAEVDIGAHPVQMLARHERPHPRLGVGAGPFFSAPTRCVTRPLKGLGTR